MTNATSLESFVASIRKLYQQVQPSMTHANQQLPSTSSPTTTSGSSSVNYVEIFTTINSHLDVLNQNPTNLLDNVLPQFVLPQYTLPHMAVLYAIMTQLNQAQNITASTSNASATSSGTSSQHQPQANASNMTFANSLLSIDQEKLLNAIQSCIELADDKQIEVASEIYAEICHFYTNKLCQLNRAKRGLPFISMAIKKIQRDPANASKTRVNLLTTVHSDLLQLSLASKNFSLALDLLANDIHDIYRQSNSQSTFDSKYLLAYFYYAGCIYAALKQYDQSLFYLEQTLTVPACMVSQIMIEAYKKFLLISLIYKGKLPQLPKYTSRLVVNQIKPMCSIYHELAVAFMNFDYDKLNSLSVKYNDIFNADKNTGLVKQLKQSYYKKNIQKLNKTFITLSLADMAQKVKLPSAKEAEVYMLNMIKDGEIFATINQKDGMVSFHDNPEKYDNPLIMEHLNKQMSACIEMDARIKEMDKEITTHPHYIQKCLNNSTSASDDGVDQLMQTTSSLMRQHGSSSGSNFI